MMNQAVWNMSGVVCSTTTSKLMLLHVWTLKRYVSECRSGTTAFLDQHINVAVSGQLHTDSNHHAKWNKNQTLKHSNIHCVYKVLQVSTRPDPVILRLTQIYKRQKDRQTDTVSTIILSHCVIGCWQSLYTPWTVLSTLASMPLTVMSKMI